MHQHIIQVIRGLRFRYETKLHSNRGNINSASDLFATANFCSLQRIQTEAKFPQTQVSSLQRTPAKPRFATAKESLLQRINHFSSQAYSLHHSLQRTIRYSE